MSVYPSKPMARIRSFFIIRDEMTYSFSVPVSSSIRTFFPGLNLSSAVEEVTEIFSCPFRPKKLTIFPIFFFAIMVIPF